jgi:uncharacterized surface protein with fasciclin (FAS1) repeats
MNTSEPIMPAGIDTIVRNAAVATANTTNPFSLTTMETALRAAGFLELLGYVSASDGIARDVNNPTQMTLFAPDDVAWAQVNASLTKKLLQPVWIHHLKSVLRHHMVDGRVNATQMLGTGRLRMLSGYFQTYNNITVGRAAVFSGDISAYNGVVHVVNKVMLPPTVQSTIWEQLQSIADFSQLVSLIEFAGLEHIFSGLGPLTFFALPNPALIGMNLTSLTKDDVTNMLLYHTLGDNVFTPSMEAASTGTLRTLLSDISISFIVTTSDSNSNSSQKRQQSQIAFNGNSYLDRPRGDNLLASNGVIHIVSSVLKAPPTSAPAIAADVGFASPPDSSTSTGGIDQTDGTTTPAPTTPAAPVPKTTSGGLSSVSSCALTATLVSLALGWFL